jgi:hypothetical protein
LLLPLSLSALLLLLSKLLLQQWRGEGSLLQLIIELPLPSS